MMFIIHGAHFILETFMTVFHACFNTSPLSRSDLGKQTNQ